MPTLPLYALPNHSADASHRVMSPGGYEGWYFYAEDPGTDTRVVAGLVEGPAFHAGYLKKYRNYLAAPTRRAPPAPSEFPCAFVTVYRGGKVVGQFLGSHPAGSLVASIDEMDVRLGPNAMMQTAEGYHVELSEGVNAKLKFSPLWPHREWEGTYPSRELTGADHRWVIAAPICEVSGAVGGVEFNGRGCHDHHFGTAPLSARLRRWMRGHVLLRDRAVAFAVAEGREGTIEGKWVAGDSSGISERQVSSWTVDSDAPVPRTVRCGDALILSNPQVVDSSGNMTRVAYAVQVEGEHGTAWCEIQRSG